MRRCAIGGNIPSGANDAMTRALGKLNAMSRLLINRIEGFVISAWLIPVTPHFQCAAKVMTQINHAAIGVMDACITQIFNINIHMVHTSKFVRSDIGNASQMMLVLKALCGVLIKIVTTIILAGNAKMRVAINDLTRRGAIVRVSFGRMRHTNAHRQNQCPKTTISHAHLPQMMDINDGKLSCIPYVTDAINSLHF